MRVHALAVALVLSAATAQAADQGFYLRLDGGIAISRDTSFRDEDPSLPGSPLLAGYFGNTAPIQGDYGNSAIVSGGAGYRWLPWLRTDVTAAYRPNFEFDGAQHFSGPGISSSLPFFADVENWTVMLNAYLDIGGFAPEMFGMFQPYIGGGLGYSRTKIETVRTRGPFGSHIIDGGTSSDLAWMVTIGTGIALTPGILLDFGYKYVDFGTISTDRGQVISPFGGSPVSVDPIVGDLRAHELTVGMRFQF